MQDTWPFRGEIHGVDSPESRIISATYDFLGDAAIDLFRKIKSKVDGFVEPINFGDQALDIGSRDGRYIPVMKEFGLSEVTAIDPNGEDMNKGLSTGLIEEDKAFVGTLEEWLEMAGGSVECAFVLNMNPSLPRSPGFVSALMDVVKPGGVLVTSFVEDYTARSFATATYWRGYLEPIKRKPVDRESQKRARDRRELEEVKYPGDYRSELNGWLSIGVRTEKVN